MKMDEQQQRQMRQQQINRLKKIIKSREARYGSNDRVVQDWKVRLKQLQKSN